MKGIAFGFTLLLLLTMLLGACKSSGATTGPTTSAPTTGGQTTAQMTTKAVEKPQYGGTLNLVMTADIASWDYGLTFC